MRLSRQILDNGLRPVICSVGLAEQVFPAADRYGLRVRMLALVCGEAIIRARAKERGHGDAWPRTATHVSIDDTLRRTRAVAPHEFTLLDTSELRVKGTIAEALRWAHGSEADREPDPV